MIRRNSVISIIALLVFLNMGFFGYAFIQKNKFHQNNIKTITIHNTQFTVEVARTSAEWERGVQGRNSLAQRNGMIFLFPKKDTYVFWMKNTLIPLDFIWVADGVVVGITPNGQPEKGVSIDSQLKEYPAPQKVDTVIELNAGEAKLYGISKGDTIKIEE